MKQKRESKCCMPQVRRRGRPVQIDQDTREEIVLDATTQLLSELRLDEVTMAAIADRAGMSKRTVYGMFENREHLLGACIARIGKTVFRPLSPAERRLPVAARLKRVLTHNEVPGFEDNSLELLRAIIASTRTYPLLARRTSEKSTIALAGMVIEELQAAVQAGELSIPADQMQLHADLLVGMALENPVPRLLDPELPLSTPEEIAARRNLAVDLFVKATSASTER